MLWVYVGSNSDTNVAWYEEDSRVSPEEIVIQLRTRDEKIVGSSKARKNNRGKLYNSPNDQAGCMRLII